MTYLQQRLKENRISDKHNKIKAVNLDNKSQEFYFFSDDGKDNIKINYLTPGGEIEYYQAGKKTIPFSRIRLKNPENPKNKYHQERGTDTVPFSTPNIITSYKKGEKVKTLYITEGEFKAFSLNMLGLKAFGIGGIHNYKSKSKGQLHPYIIDYIKKCNVENIVLLFDADCLNVEWHENKEMTTRLSSFYSALNTFNEYIKPFDVCLYFAHIKTDSEHKGIDDLLAHIKDKENVLNELQSLIVNNDSRQYVKTYKISGVSPYLILKIFGLDSVNTFFQNNFSLLAEKEFIYKGDPYYCDESGKLIVSWKGEQNNYIRIGTDFFKKVVETSPNGQKEINLKKWNIATIKADYANSKEFLKRVEKCDSFTNIPENEPAKFKQIVFSEKNGIKSILYNRYFPVSHVPETGSWENINTLIHHIFDYKNSSGQSLYEFALDYLQLIYTRPLVKLPVICLVSKENGTGKTTFLNFLRAIFIENMRILDSDRISSQFNGSWAGKLIVAIDESLIAMDRDTVKNRIKMIATNQTIPLEEKGMESREIPNFAKLIMCSNDETNFMRIDAEENRYCIIKVGSIPNDRNDPDMMEKMEKEIPAFLQFLKNRTIYYPKKTRLYFDEKVYTTPALERVKERTEAPLIKNIKDVIINQFHLQEKEYIKLSLNVLTRLVSNQYKYADRIKIQEYLNDKNYKTGNATNFEYMLEGDLVPIEDKGKCYEFYIKDFFTDEQYTEFIFGK